MADGFTYLSTYFECGAQNVSACMEIYKKMKQKEGDDSYYLAVKVADQGMGAEDDGRLWLCHTDWGHGDVVGHAVAFVSECARSLKLSGTWWAAWSTDCTAPLPDDAYGGGLVMMDLATQAVTYLYPDKLIDLAKKELESVISAKSKFPFEVVMKPDWRCDEKWMEENVGTGHWGSYAKVGSINDDGNSVDTLAVMFDTERAAVQFKQTFGDFTL